MRGMYICTDGYTYIRDGFPHKDFIGIGPLGPMSKNEKVFLQDNHGVGLEESSPREGARINNKKESKTRKKMFLSPHIKMKIV
jgi:hypothetical protein